MSETSSTARRTQADRTAETRQLLLQAAVGLLHEKGYSGTTTERIADEAGVSRGALRHHFPTRAALMAEIIGEVFEQETREYEDIRAKTGKGSKVSDWPELLWGVLSRPSGMAVLEILQASRSDPELAALVGPMQSRVEQAAASAMGVRFGADEEAIRTMMRLLVWSIRGLAIAEVLSADPAASQRSVRLLRRIIKGAVAAGAIIEEAPES